MLNNTINLIGAIVLVVYVIVATALGSLQWLEKYPVIKKLVESKALLATLLIVAIILLFGVFENINAVREALNVPPPSLKAPPAPSIQKQPPSSNAVRIETPKSKPQLPVQVNSAPNGFAIGGGIVTNPTVNNYGPLLPHISWKIDDGVPLPERATRPAVWVRISIDRSFEEPKFAVICDRPCQGVGSQLIMPGGGIAQDIFNGRLQNQPNITAFVINQPNPMPAADSYLACVESDDDQPIRVLDVKTLVIKQPPTN